MFYYVLLLLPIDHKYMLVLIEYTLIEKQADLLGKDEVKKG